LFSASACVFERKRDVLFHDKDQLSYGLERVPKQQDLGMSQQVHDGHFLAKLVSLSWSQFDELGRECPSTAQLRAQTDVTELSSVTDTSAHLSYWS